MATGMAVVNATAPVISKLGGEDGRGTMCSGVVAVLYISSLFAARRLPGDLDG